MSERRHHFFSFPDTPGYGTQSPADIFSALPTLDTPRLTLRSMRMSDAQDIFDYSSDPAVAQYCLWIAHKSIGETRAYIRQMIRQYHTGAPSSWCIVQKGTGKVIGTIGYMLYDESSSWADVGYSLSHREWGKGYATEALQAVIDFSFPALALNRIEAQHDVRNPASGRVMEKCGMKPEGILRQKFFNKGEYIDVQVWSILQSEYSKNE